MIYYYDAYGNVTTTADPQRGTELVPPTCPNGEQPNWTGQGWACMLPSVPVLPGALPVGHMNAYDWYMLFTLPEMIAIHTLTTTDASVYTFMHVLEQTIAAGKDVISNSSMVLAGVAYLQTVPPASPVLSASRAAELLAAINQ
jgi:hypothetical protein